MRLSILLCFLIFLSTSVFADGDVYGTGRNYEHKLKSNDDIDISNYSDFTNDKLELIPVIVTGRVTSGTDGFGLPGVNVVVKGTKIGTITDIDGNFQIEVPEENSVLVFSFIGYVSREEVVNSRSVIDISLTENTELLSEIVVTGLSIERDKSSLGYSVSQVSGADINTAKADNFADALSGKVAGLQITKSANGVGGSSRIVLRGISSMQGNNRPLFVIDGVPMPAGYNSGNSNKDGGDGLADINPEDIETVTVLKGAGAAAVYGSRGANGVILITTKKGTLKKGLGIGFSSSYAVESPLVLPDLQNEYGQGGLSGRYPITDGENTMLDHPNIWSYGPPLSGKVRWDWAGNRTRYEKQPNQFREYLRTGSSVINNLSFESGSDNSSLRVSLTDQRSKGIIPANNLTRQTVNVRGLSKIGELFEIDSKVTYIHHDVENRPLTQEHGGNSALSLSVIPRNIGIESLRNNVVDEFGNEMTWSLDPTWGNPYWSLQNRGNNDIKDRYQTFLSIKTHITDDLNLLLRSGLDQSSIEDKNWANRGSRNAANGRGEYSHQLSRNTEWNSDFLISYNKVAQKIDYSFNFGGNYRIENNNTLNQWGSGYQIPGYYHISNLSEFYTNENSSRKEVASLYGFGSASYADVYLDITYRSDWSSALAVNANQFNYYSVNLSWLFSNSLTLPSWFSNGKLRGSVAQTGNDTNPYNLEIIYGVVQSQLPFNMASIPDRLLTPDLLPEINNTWEVGTELGFINDRFTLDFTYYFSNAKNQIMPVPLPASTGFSSKVLNSGELENSGIELQINASIFDQPDGFSWNSRLTYTKNNSMVKSIHPDLESITLNTSWHATIEARPGHEYGQIYGYDYKRNEDGVIMLDDLGVPKLGNIIAHGSINPDYLVGFSNTFSYKNVSLSFLIDASMGSEIYSFGKTYKMLFGTDAETLEGRQEWFDSHDENGAVLPGVEAGGYVFDGIIESTGERNTNPIFDPALLGYVPYNLRVISGSVLDASNIRLREAIISYRFPNEWISKIRMTDFTISATGRNLYFFFRPTDHIDPESGYSSGNTGNGFEQSALPSTRSIGLNLRAKF